MSNCAACGASNAYEAQFCASCGAGLQPVCHACGASLPLEARFCSACGTPVHDTPVGEERKLVTILFADVTGSTALGERLDPERLRDVLATYFAAMREEIEAEGGTVEKFIGDAVMAAFGVPAAHEDDPARALRAAGRMLDRLGSVNERLASSHGVTLQIRIGVNTGEVLATTSPRPGEPMVTGDAVNAAARLQAAAEPDRIVASERTVRAVRGFTFDDLGPLDLKGKAEPVRAFALRGDAPLLQEALGEACFVAYEGDLAWRYFREATQLLAGSVVDDGERVAYLAARACEVPQRWPGSIRGTLPTELEAKEIYELGRAALPPGDSEARIRLLGVHAGWPFGYPPPPSATEDDLRPFEAAGIEAAEVAMRMGLPNLASGALDAANAAWTSLGYYAHVLPIWEKRAAMLPDVTDTNEIGDTYAWGPGRISSWAGTRRRSR